MQGDRPQDRDSRKEFYRIAPLPSPLGDKNVQTHFKISFLQLHVTFMFF